MVINLLSCLTEDDDFGRSIGIVSTRVKKRSKIPGSRINILNINDQNLELDSFFNEQELYTNKKIFEVIDKLKQKDLIYEKDGAIWFNLTKIGKEQDRVLVKSTGEPTYSLPDMAYHINKLERKYDVCIDIFGADNMDAYPDVLEVLKQLEYDYK